MLLGNQKSWRFNEKILLVVIFYWRLLVELDYRRFFSDCDFRALYLRQDVLPQLPEGVSVTRDERDLARMPASPGNCREVSELQRAHP